MIQRIQSVYLALVAVLSILGLCLPLGQYYDGANLMATLGSFVFNPTEAYDAAKDWGAIGLAVMDIIIFLLTLMTIMLFRYRMRQLRLAIFSTILLVGTIAYFAVLAWKFNMQMQSLVPDASFHLCVAALFPVFSIIFNCLAIHGIRKDEALVRSLDRLR